MKIVTINLADPYLAELEKLVEYGLYPSRSEGIRAALRDFLPKELQLAQEIGARNGEQPNTRGDVVEVPLTS